MYLLWAYFDMILISAYPLKTYFVPIVVRVPKVENRCIIFIIQLKIQ